MRAEQRNFGVLGMSRSTGPDRRPDDTASAGTLRTLSAEAYQPKLLEKNLIAREAERRITALKAEIELANSF
jgi:hypothetical protein